MSILILYGLLSLYCGALTALAAGYKDRNVVLWFIYGALTLIFGFVHALYIRPANMARCPHCLGRYFEEATVCICCGRDVLSARQEVSRRLKNGKNSATELEGEVSPKKPKEEVKQTKSVAALIASDKSAQESEKTLTKIPVTKSAEISANESENKSADSSINKSDTASDTSAKESTKESTEKSDSASTNKTADVTTDESKNKKADDSTNKTASESIKESENKLADTSANKSTKESTNTSKNDSTKESDSSTKTSASILIKSQPIDEKESAEKAEDENPELLRLDNVSMFYEHIHALRGVSLHVNKGETVALIGANGAGKSSILRAITGLYPIRSGGIYYCGKRLDGRPSQDIVKLGISMAPEGRRVFPYMSVCDNLLLGAFARTDKAGIREDLEKVLDKFPRLRERYRQGAGTMSGGEQQMLVIGRALMARPNLLLLDEPSLGIAPKLVQSIARSIVAINREDKVSVILVEQNSRMALKISHRAYALSVGEVVVEGNSQELQNDDRIRRIYLGGEV